MREKLLGEMKKHLKKMQVLDAIASDLSRCLNWRCTACCAGQIHECSGNTLSRQQSVSMIYVRCSD